MNVLVTGAKGFIGRNLVSMLYNIKDGKDKAFLQDPNIAIYEYDTDTEQLLLEKYCREADFIFHLAGVNRPKEQSEFMEGNLGFTRAIIDILKKYNNTCPVVISSSIQADTINPYGQSKKAVEDLVFSYARETNTRVMVYRFPNVFGKWCRPNYNSVVATFCNNITNDLPITIHDRSTVLNLVYIDDVVTELVRALYGQATPDRNYFKVPIVYTKKLGEIADLIYSFRDSRINCTIPNMSDGFIKKLHATYLSYLPKEKLKYRLTMNCDNRGSFTEIIKTPDRGQFSINIIKPGIIKGNHWHNTKNEKFIVVSGTGIIRLRSVYSDEVIEFHVSGEKIEVVDIPSGYTHNIENLGDVDMVTLMWANEVFTPEKPDTYYLEV